MDVRHPGWRDELEDTNYPFADHATLDNGQGAAFLRRTLLDATVHLWGAELPVWISRVTVGPDRIELAISDGSQNERCWGSFDSRIPPDRLALYDEFGRPAGVLVSEPLRMASLASWGQGTHRFEPEHTELVASVVVPLARPYAVEGFQIGNDPHLVRGDVWLVADDGIVFTCEDGGTHADGQPIHRIRVHATGDPLFRRKLCGEEAAVFETPRFIQQICFSNPGYQFGRSSSLENFPENADVLWLCDTTGSMYQAIQQVRRILPDVAGKLAERLSGKTRIFWAAAEYKDREDAFAWRINQPFTESVERVQQAMGEWQADGGGDWPEAQLPALRYLAQRWDTELQGRIASETTRVIIWTGDAPGHVDSGEFYGDVSAAIAALTAASVRVLALDVYGPPSTVVGLDADVPDTSYPDKQATEITQATNGALLYHAYRDYTADKLVDWIVQHLWQILTGGHTTVVEPQLFCCGPGNFGDIKILVGHRDNPKTTLRIAPYEEGLVIETVGERLPTIRE